MAKHAFGALCTYGINSNRIGLVNKTDVSIHHAVKPVLFLTVAFIFDKRATLMVNRRVGRKAQCAREPGVKLIGLHQRLDC